jgi:membrane protein
VASSALRKKLNAVEVPKSNGLGAGDLAAGVIEQIEEDRVKAYAGNLAYRGLFAIFAMLILLFSLLGIFQAEHLVEAALERLSDVLPDPVKESFEKQILDQTQGESPGQAPALRALIAILGSIYGLSAMARGVIDAMNVMHSVEEKRPFWKRQGMSIVMAAVVMIMLVTALLTVVIGPTLDPLFRVARWPLVVALVLLAYALVYYYAPSVKESFRLLTHGSVIAVPLWVIFSLAFSFYVDRFGNFEETYGALAGLVVLLLYMFVSAFILLIGAEVNHVVARHQGRKQPAPAD